MRLIDNFPGDPRPEQEYIIDRIQAAFDTGKKYVLVQAPTGVGKSHIGATLARSTTATPKAREIRYSNPQQFYQIDPDSYPSTGAFVLTTTKQLQDQYAEMFSESAKLKGKDNYICDLDPTCDVTMAPCAYISNQMEKCAKSKNCPYINAFRDAMSNKFSELNYSMYFSLPPALKKKEILICDEASELEDCIISHFSLDITYKLLDFLKVPYSRLTDDSPERAYLWACDLRESVITLNNTAKTRMSELEIKRYKALKQLKERLTLITNHWRTSEFIVELKKDGVCICPLKANKLSKVVFSYAERIVFMSATIINYEVMAESLGLSQDEYEFVDVPSSFDPKKSPIYISPAKYDMRYGKIDSELPKLVEDVLELCEIHKNDKGIIHTNSFKINDAFKRAVGNNPRFLIREEGVSNETLLNEHFQRKDATVLVSPSLAFGTSLDDEHGRFQVITKLPYLPMSDKRVKLMSERSFDWYQMKMWIKLVQMCGRCTRSKDDHSATYIFDASFISALKKYKNKLPKWFINRLV
jgi:ATP-dependent DNA helicase DinG